MTGKILSFLGCIIYAPALSLAYSFLYLLAEKWIFHTDTVWKTLGAAVTYLVAEFIVRNFLAPFPLLPLMYMCCYRWERKLVINIFRLAWFFAVYQILACPVDSRLLLAGFWQWPVKALFIYHVSRFLYAMANCTRQGDAPDLSYQRDRFWKRFQRRIGWRTGEK